MRETIAKIIDPHSFLPDNSSDDLIAEMVKQGKEDAFRKADRVILALSSSLEGLPNEPMRAPLGGRDEMLFGTCPQCDTRQNLARAEDGGVICGSCADANYLAEWIDYGRALRSAITPAVELRPAVAQTQKNARHPIKGSGRRWEREKG